MRAQHEDGDEREDERDPRVHTWRPGPLLRLIGDDDSLTCVIAVCSCGEVDYVPVGGMAGREFFGPAAGNE